MRLMRLTGAVIGAMIGSGWAAAAHSAGDMACSGRDEVLHQLGEQYKEAPSAVGLLADNAGLLELLESPDGATWTVIVSLPNGTSCLLAAGVNWGDAKARPMPQQQSDTPDGEGDVIDPSKGTGI